MGSYSSVVIAKGPVWNDLVYIELFGESQSIALGACPDGRVEGEEARLDFRNCYSTVRTGVLLVI